MIFHTGYRNLVLAGAKQEFCLVSGVHDPGFPWGDEGAVSDLLIAVLAPDGAVRRFVIGAPVMTGLVHDVAGGTFRYQGPIYELAAGSWRIALSELATLAATGGVTSHDADITLALDVVPLHSGQIKLPRIDLLEELKKRTGGSANNVLGDEKGTLGMAIDPAAVIVRSGSIKLGSALTVDATGARGEGEVGDYVALLRPALGYHYLCALHPAGGAVDGAVQVVTDVLDPGGGGLIEDTVAHTISSVLRRTADVVASWKDGVADARDAPDNLPYAVAEPILKLCWDTLDTGVFERKLVWIEHAGKRLLGLEEAMMLKQSYGAASRTQAVADVFVVKNPDKLAALASVLEQTGFDDHVRAHAAGLGVALGKLKIAVKPNFMFMYSTNDPSTYTDPTLVIALIDRLAKLGCKDIAVVEAQSAYGNYFEGREVRRVAEYCGYSLSDPRYRVVDLTQEMVPFEYGHKLGHHVVGPTWRDAHMRLTFSKNKTHTWSYYTLGIKNTYGCLPMQNKLLEYHNKREIYFPTIDALRHFPVHFSLVDASLSADGQFGIFADRHPNKTETIFGGKDIVATDWVGACKMGLDPMVSRYMREAVFAFGKPEIVVHGDRTRYPDWRNVEAAMTEFWDRAEESYPFSDLLFRVLNEMDGHFPRKKENLFIRIFRWMTGWMRRLIFKTPRRALPAGTPPKLPERHASGHASK